MATTACLKGSTHRESKKDERMVLIGTDKEVFLDAVMNPSAPSERLVVALRRHREILG
jgi:hypothetical protein